jgi:hypothetical protein
MFDVGDSRTLPFAWRKGSISFRKGRTRRVPTGRFRSKRGAAMTASPNAEIRSFFPESTDTVSYLADPRSSRIGQSGLSSPRHFSASRRRAFLMVFNSAIFLSRSSTCRSATRFTSRLVRL